MSPKYISIADNLRTEILFSGCYANDQNIESIRILSKRYKVSINTILKSLEVLINDNILVKDIKHKIHINPNAEYIASLAKAQIKQYIINFLSEMTTHGIDSRKSIALLTDYLQRSDSKG